MARAPYRKAGLLYRKFTDNFGKDSDDVLVIQAPSIVLNPTLNQADIDAALAEDPAGAGAEWLAIFRDDVSGWATRELIEAAVDRDVQVRPPRPDVRYHSFIDASGGAHNSFCAAVAHEEGGLVILDNLVEIRAPFNPDGAARAICDMLKAYRCYDTTGDTYGKAWVKQTVAKNGVTLHDTRLNRSEIYLNCLPLFTAGRARLTDHKRTVSQFASLERITMPSSKDRIDHPRGGYDDCANTVAGALVQAAMEREQKIPCIMPVVMTNSDPLGLTCGSQPAQKVDSTAEWYKWSAAGGSGRQWWAA